MNDQISDHIFEPQERFLSSSPRGETGGEPSPYTVVVSIGAGSADDVVPLQASGGHMLTPAAIRERDAKLVGGLFLPKGCAVDLEVGANSERFGSSGRPDPIRVSGTVRRVQMTDVTPTYSIWVEFDPPGVELLARWRVELPGERGT